VSASPDAEDPNLEDAMKRRESLAIATDVIDALLANVKYLIEEQTAITAGPRRAGLKTVTLAINNAAFSLQHADTEGETRPTEPDYTTPPGEPVGG